MIELKQGGNNNLKERETMKHIIFTSEPDYKQASDYIEGELAGVKNSLEKLASANWLGSVLASACEKRIEELKSEEAYNQTEFWRECEKANLDQNTGEIVIIADLGLWDGRVAGVKETGEYNLNAILEYHGRVDDIEVYTENGEVRGMGHHHDGTNHYIFREVANQEKWDKLAEKIAAGEKYTEKELNGATKSLVGRVNKIYGWGEK